MERFLTSSHTLAAQPRDFPEWHRGIETYGVWVVLIEDAEWLEFFEGAQRHVQRWVHPGYRRAAHVTVAACGLVDKAYFSEARLQQQRRTLQQLDAVRFEIRLDGLDSFLLSPYLGVCDPSGELSRLRKALMSVATDGPPQEYVPHLTLGMYRDRYATHEVAHHLNAFETPPVCPLEVTELAFCTYKTAEFQGPLTVRDRFVLKGDVDADDSEGLRLSRAGSGVDLEAFVPEVRSGG